MYPETLTAARKLLMEKIDCDIYSLRFLKPFDTEYFLSIAEAYSAVLFIEDGVLKGSFSEGISLEVKNSAFRGKVSYMGFPDEFLSNGTREQILFKAGLDSASIYHKAKSILEEK